MGTVFMELLHGRISPFIRDRMREKIILNPEKIAAIRTLSIGSQDVKVIIGVPVMDGDDYVCPYQIKGIGDEIVRGMYGIDAVQALQLTLQILATELSVLKQDYPHLVWRDDSSGELGF